MDLIDKTIDGITYPLVSEMTYEGLVNAIQSNKYPEYREIYKTARRHFEEGLIHCMTVEKEHMGPSYMWLTTEQKHQYEAAPDSRGLQ